MLMLGLRRPPSATSRGRVAALAGWFAVAFAAAPADAKLTSMSGPYDGKPQQAQTRPGNDASVTPATSTKPRAKRRRRPPSQP